METWLNSPNICACRALIPTGVRVDYAAGVRSCPGCASLLDPRQYSARVRVLNLTSVNADWAYGDAEVESGDADLPVRPNTVISIVGAIGEFEPDTQIEVTGMFKSHPRFGLQFDIRAAIEASPSTEDLQTFLEQLPSMGPARVAAVFKEFKTREEILNILEYAPERLTVIDGITGERARKIHEAFMANTRDLREVLIWLSEFKLSNAVTMAIARTWGARAKEYLTANPYLITNLRGVGFKRADAIAIERFRVDPNDVRRASAAIVYALDDAAGEGSTYVFKSELIGHAPLESL